VFMHATYIRYKRDSLSWCRQARLPGSTLPCRPASNATKFELNGFQIEGKLRAFVVGVRESPREQGCLT